MDSPFLVLLKLYFLFVAIVVVVNLIASLCSLLISRKTRRYDV
ncbi:hypothetical protein BH11PAT4_BH11PAT4_7670 [soil metagenome]